MTNRREFICAQILEQLADWDTPVNEAVLEAGVSPRIHPRLLSSEFDEALRLCERSKWISGIPTGLNGVRWHITDHGRAELNR